MIGECRGRRRRSCREIKVRASIGIAVGFTASIRAEPRREMLMFNCIFSADCEGKLWCAHSYVFNVWVREIYDHKRWDLGVGLDPTQLTFLGCLLHKLPVVFEEMTPRINLSSKYRVTWLHCTDSYQIPTKRRVLSFSPFFIFICCNELPKSCPVLSQFIL